MFLLLPSIGLGIIAGFIRGGDLSRLAELRFRYGWLVIVAFLVQLAIFTSWFTWLNLRADLIPFLHIASLFVLLMVVLANRSFFGLNILGIGLMLNFLVIVANGGFMPVSGKAMQQIGLVQELATMREQGYSSKGTLATPDTPLAFLGDNFHIDAPFVREKVFSMGDALIGVGAFIFVSQAMVRRRRRWGWS